MKKILILICLCSIYQGYAQISPKVIARFPAHIVCNLNELNSKIALSEESQLQLAQRLLTNDSLANVQKSNLPPAKLKEFYAINKALLQGVLDQKELDNFLYQEDKDNRFLLALVKAQQLKLSEKQIEAIKKQMDYLENQTNKDSINLIPHYKKKLDSILDKKQNSLLGYFVHIEPSKAHANKVWETITKFNLVRNKDPKKAYNELLNYVTSETIYLDEKAKKFNEKQLKDEKTKFMLEKQPLFLLHKKIIVDNMFQNNFFAMALLHEKQLELLPNQVDSLLVKCRELELLKNTKKGNETVIVAPFINKNTLQILTPKQVQIVLIKKNEKEALRFANDSWDDLEKQKLVTGIDKVQTLKEFKIYKLRSLVIVEKIKMDSNQVNLFEKRDIENKKPELLKKLDEINQAQTKVKSTKNDLKW
jgi:hypothetical protein